jgi:site-specific DNA-cytosine methylase
MQATCAGCGGLSQGFQEAGVMDTKRHWCIDSWTPAVTTFKRNFPHCTVVQEDCNVVLYRIAQEAGQEDQLKTNAKVTKERADRMSASIVATLPKPGQVELIASGSACQV